MKDSEISRATLGRIPAYLRYLKKLPPQTRNISATTIAKELGLGEVQVRKDLGALCGSGKPKIGYITEGLRQSLESFLENKNGGTIIVEMCIRDRLKSAVIPKKSYKSGGNKNEDITYHKGKTGKKPRRADGSCKRKQHGNDRRMRKSVF